MSMISTGVVRKLDPLGRIVIPKEIRTNLNIGDRDPMEILINGDHVILRKYHSAQACHITGKISSENLVLAEGKLVLSPEGLQHLLSEIEEKNAQS